jgi:hypothetical protein
MLVTLFFDIYLYKKDLTLRAVENESAVCFTLGDVFIKLGSLLAGGGVVDPPCYAHGSADCSRGP